MELVLIQVKESGAENGEEIREKRCNGATFSRTTDLLMVTFIHSYDRDHLQNETCR